MKLRESLQKITKAPLYRNSFTLVSGTFIAQLFLLVISPILTMLYSPEEFGVYGAFLSVSTILAMIGTGRYELAILLPKKDKDGYYIFLLSLLLAAFFGVLLLLIIFLTQSFYFWDWVTALRGNYLFLIPPGVFLFSMTMPAAFLANRFKKFRLLSFSKIAGSGSTGLLGLLFGSVGITFGGLIFSKLIGWLVETGVIVVPILKKATNAFKPFEKSRLFKQAKKYQNFPKFSIPEGLLNTGFKQIPILALTMFFSPELAGFFTLTSSILAKPFGMVSMSFGHVFFQKATEVDHPDKLRPIFSELLRFLFLLAIVPTALLFIFAPSVFSWVFGQVWATSGIYARWMLPFFFVTYLKSPFSGMVDVKNAFVRNLFFEVGFVGIALAAFAIGHWQKDDLLAIKIFSLGNGVLGLIQLYWFKLLIEEEGGW